MGKRSKKKNRSMFDIDELDDMLEGGIPIGGCVLLSGASGLGKTILAMQWLFNGFQKSGEPGVYITSTEPVVKAISNVRTLDFFDANCINPLNIHMTDLRTIISDLNIGKDGQLSSTDSNKILEVIKNLVRQTGAKRLVMDSVTALCYRLGKPELIRSFIFKLGSVLGNLDCTAILTSEVPIQKQGYSIFGVEEFISDGIIYLKPRKDESSLVRELQIIKMRGTNFSSKSVVYKILSKGFELYPMPMIEQADEITKQRLKTGIDGFDSMIGGGLFKNSTTLLTGASGTGKTLFAQNYIIEGIKKKQRGLYISYEEGKTQLCNYMIGMGFDPTKHQKKGSLVIESIFPDDTTIEEQLNRIIGLLEKCNAKRFVLDSLSSLVKKYGEEQVIDFTKRLNSVLKQKGITTIFTNATSDFVGTSELTSAGLSTVTDNIIMLRYVEIQSSVRRYVTAIKIRGSNHDKTLREYEINDSGIRIKDSFKGLQGVFSGNVTSVMDDKISKAFEELAKGEK